MIDENSDSIAGPDGASSASEDKATQGAKRAKTKIQSLEEVHGQHQKFVSSVMRAAPLIGIFIAGAIALQLFAASSKNELARPEKTISVDAVLDCDNEAAFAKAAGHPCNLKKQFEDKYRTLSTQFMPVIEASQTEEFVQSGLIELQEFEKKAIKAFDTSSFANAVLTVDEALQKAQALTEAITENFQNSFDNAQAAFLNNDPAAAQEWIDRALRLNGQDASAQHLHGRIVVLPEVMSLFQKAAEAEVQNQLLDLQKYLRKIAALDPERQDVVSQLAGLNEQLKQAEYSEHLRRASEFIKNENIQATRQELNSANALYSGRQDVKNLLAQVEKIEKGQRINTLLGEAKTFEGQDQWKQAFERYSQILVEDSENRAAINGQKKANTIISANNRVVNILNNQHRLQDAEVHQRTIEFTNLAKPYAQDSEILEKSIAALEKTLTLWQQEITVTVHSDGKSEIIIRRLGRIGTVKKKEIQLRPGKYDFECIREGYRSKIVEHFVPPDTSSTSVTISCDVRI